MKEFVLVTVPLVKQTPTDVPAVFVRSTIISGLRDSGLTPLIVSPAMSKEQLENLYLLSSGIVFTGGRDWNPQLYGQLKAPETEEPDYERDEMELMLFGMALNDNKAMLGFCRGHQGIVVALYYYAGTKPDASVLTQHLSPEIFDHSAPRYEDLKLEKYQHEIRIVPESRTGQLYRRKVLKVPSGHHQAVNPEVLPELGLAAWAYSARDHVVEGVESGRSKLKIIGTQFHPEIRTSLRAPLFNWLAYHAAEST